MRELADKLARVLGYVDYPDDSVEQDDTWHKNPELAPFGPCISKTEFARTILDPVFVLTLIDDYCLEFKWLTDATLEVHSVITDKTITTTNGYRMGVLECLTL